MLRNSNNSWREIRDKPQYPSWPSPIRTLKCKLYGFEFQMIRSGRAELAHARRMMRAHKCDPAPWLSNGR